MATVYQSLCRDHSLWCNSKSDVLYPLSSSLLSVCGEFIPHVLSSRHPICNSLHFVIKPPFSCNNYLSLSTLFLLISLTLPSSLTLPIFSFDNSPFLPFCFIFLTLPSFFLLQHFFTLSSPQPFLLPLPFPFSPSTTFFSISSLLFLISSHPSFFPFSQQPFPLSSHYFSISTTLPSLLTLPSIELSIATTTAVLLPQTPPATISPLLFH